MLVEVESIHVVRASRSVAVMRGSELNQGAALRRQDEQRALRQRARVAEMENRP
jgi:hypothetical protein